MLDFLEEMCKNTKCKRLHFNNLHNRLDMEGSGNRRPFAAVSWMFVLCRKHDKEDAMAESIHSG